MKRLTRIVTILICISICISTAYAAKPYPDSFVGATFEESSQKEIFEYDTVIGLIGDSITHGAEQAAYQDTGWFVQLEYYLVTRFPERNVRILNLGSNGITTKQVVQYKMQGEYLNEEYDKAVVYLGTNDVSDYNSNPATWKAYYTTILDGLKNKGVETIALITPVGRDSDDYAADNATMLAIANQIEGIASEKGIKCVAQWDNFNSTQSNLWAQTRKTLMQDTLHPDCAGSALTFAEFVRALNLPGEVATVGINGKYGKLMNQGNCTVSDFKVEGNTISYNYLANSIPMSKNIDFVAEGEKIMDYIDSISYEMFKVADLPAGEYKLLIDGGEIATFTAEELAQGVNLAHYNTPMIKQSESAAKLVTTLTEYQRTLRTMIVCEFRAEIYGGAKTQEAREAWMRGRINAGGDSYASRYNQYLSQIRQQSIDKRYEFIEMMWKNAYNAAKPVTHKIELVNLSGDYVIEDEPIIPPVDDTTDTPDTPDTPDAPKGNITPVIIAVVAVVAIAAVVVALVVLKKKKK